MESSRALGAFAALSQATRLATFRALVAAEPAGLPAGELARGLEVPANTLSTHLAILAQAGLVESRRAGRQVIYRARLDRVRDLTLFLLRDCCGGQPGLCATVTEGLSGCAGPIPQPETVA